MWPVKATIEIHVNTKSEQVKNFMFPEQFVKDQIQLVCNKIHGQVNGGLQRLEDELSSGTKYIFKVEHDGNT